MYKQASFFDVLAIRQAVTAYETAKTAYETGQLEAETEAHVYNDLYRFFARYYDDGDFISQRRFGPDRYALPYSGQEVYLHWANADQYYVKTGERFSNYTFTLPATVSDQSAQVVFFRLQKAETDRDNTKSSDKRFFTLNPETPYHWDESSRLLTLNFEYRALTPAESERVGSRNQQDKLNEEAVQRLAETLPNPYLKAQLLQPDGSDGDRSRFIRHLHRYTARHTRDYFIHKNLAPFLRQELDYFLKNEILGLDDIDMNNPVRARLALARVRVIRHIAHYIIAFLAQIENFQKRLFEKRKFVLQSDYCLTLDRIPEAVRDELYAALLHNEPQLQAWRDLYALDQTEPTLFNPNGNLTGITEAFLKLHPHLMLDTAYLESGLKVKLLAAFDNLDATIDGLLIHSENFQALNLLLPRYQEKVKCIYIDPPYNTGNDEFIYKDNFRHSSWLAMMENRLRVARDILAQDGVIFLSVDEKELAHLKLLLINIFENNLVGEIIWKNATDNNPTRIAQEHEYVLCFAKNLEQLPREWKSPFSDAKEILLDYYDYLKGNTLSIEEMEKEYQQFIKDNRAAIGELVRYKFLDEEGPYTGSESVHNPHPNGYDYEIIHPITQKPMRKPVNGYRFPEETMRRDYIEKGKLIYGPDENRIVKIKLYLKDYVSPFRSVITLDGWLGAYSLNALFGSSNNVFDNPKTVQFIERLISFSAESDAEVLDFFAGSGTTAQAIIELKYKYDESRKYTMIEMGDYFDTVLKPRIQKVAYAAEWRDGQPVPGSEGQSQMFQYIRLESYDDTLSNISFKDRRRQPTLFDLLDNLPDYRLHYMLDFETEESPVLLNLAQFSRPFDYHLQGQPVDLITTFNFLLGLRLETQREFTWETGRVVRVVGLNPQGQRVCVIWRNVPEFSRLEAEKAWLQNQVLAGLKVDLLLINGESLLPGAQPLEPEFQRLMFANVTPAPPVEVN